MYKKDYYKLVSPYLKKYDYDSIRFKDNYHYRGKLGALYTKKQTILRAWSPVVKKLEVLSYGFWHKDSDIPEEAQAVYPMRKLKKGIWEHKFKENLHYFIYRYRVTYENGEQRVCLDPYCKATTINGGHSVVFDPDQANPENWNRKRKSFTHPIDAIIYEASIRDLTMFPDTNIKEKGKFLGLTEKGKTTKNNLPVGIDYLASLGITHLQLLPFFNFATVDEINPTTEYNWGYDPVNYNVPDGSFAVDPYDPLSRIKELKTMIQVIHEHDIRLIMDVVYNHVYEVYTHPFTVLVPGYYFRHLANGKLANGTLCGNELASERSMVKRYIVDSVLYWLKEFKIDGFRFDLMGILDTFTVKKLRELFNEIDPSIILLGEGWNMGDVLPESMRATLERSQFLRHVSFFNDQFRNAVRGNVFDQHNKGFVSNGKTDYNFLNYQELQKKYADPEQMIQYAAAHDNFTLYDQISASLPDRSFEEYQRRQNLANSIVLLAQGIPFIHSGQEFMRTKFGHPNSYNAPDEVNQIVWTETDRESVNYIKSLIQFRKSHPAFKYPTFKKIINRVSMDFLSDYLLKVRIQDENNNYWVFFNAYENYSYTLIDSGEYQVYFADNKSYLENPRKILLKEGENTIQISPLSTLVLSKI